MILINYENLSYGLSIATYVPGSAEKIWVGMVHQQHYSDVIMGAMASQITSFTIVYSTSNSGADQRKHQSFASLTFVRGIHRWPVNSTHKWPVTRKCFHLMKSSCLSCFFYSPDNLFDIRRKINGLVWVRPYRSFLTHNVAKVIELFIITDSGQRKKSH